MSAQIITPFDDPTRGLVQVDTRGPERAETRYLLQMGQLLDPERIAQLDYMQGGGDEVATNCLRRTINGFLPRARFFPLEVWGISIPGCHLPDGAQDNTVRLASAMTPETIGMTQPVTGGMLNIYNSVNQRVKTFPGDEIGGILKVYGPRGVVEAPSLRGFEWWEDAAETQPGAAQLLNRDFFPEIPVQLSRLEELIDKASGRSDIHSKVAADARRSCQTTRRYMQAELGVIHTLLKQRVSPTGHHAYAYSNVHRAYLEQLEMQPQDIENSDVMMTVLAKMADRPEQSSGMSPLDIKALVVSVVEALKDDEPKRKKVKDKEE